MRKIMLVASRQSEGAAKKQIDRARIEGTPEYWERHANRCEAVGERGLAFGYRRRAEMAKACERLREVGAVAPASHEEAFMFLSIAAEIMSPNDRRRFRQRVRTYRRKIEAESEKLPRIIFVQR